MSEPKIIYQRLYVDEIVVPKDEEIASIWVTYGDGSKDELYCDHAFFENEDGEECNEDGSKYKGGF
jgi:hypothetical protein